MNKYDFLQIILILGVLIGLAPFLGFYMAKVYEGEKHVLFFLRPIERIIYSFCRIDVKREMNWKEYSKSLIVFNLFGLIFVFLLQITQHTLPFNPEHLPNVPWDLSLNTAISFATNTNWQSYSGEATLSYLTQMLGLCVQNFLSAATGMAVLMALIKGLIRRTTSDIGNFWVDVTRSILYILFPLSIILALALVSQGVVQNFSSYVIATTLEGVKQIIPTGPAASQIAIKQLGTNGGGFFGANSAHPFENPTPFSNFLEMLSILLIPAGLVFTFGKMVKSNRQGIVLFAAKFILLVVALGFALWAEYNVSSQFEGAQWMEGKETRFGITNSIIWSNFTSGASNGSINAAHSSLSPLSGGLAMLNIMLGEIVFGGVGSGLYGMILFVFITVFICGLMVGRTPEYLGKKIEKKEIQMAMLAILLPNAMILIGASLSAVLPHGFQAVLNKGPHGLSEILYAFSSASQNNGSAFAGLGTNTTYYNLFLGLCMLVGRYAVIFPVLSVAGSLAQKKYMPPGFGTFATDTYLFVTILIFVILIVGALTHLPALALGPIVEHLLMLTGKTF
ncbi:MAG: potassium-transporting ATPase subunit KdpA [Bdellovibrio sp.]|nr:potassium-transporting ATPase subunit KdpA [Bdellovibrio sp.]